MTRWLGLSALTVSVLLIAVDGTVLALATPFISADLGATNTQMLWIGDIYSFVLGALLITMGSLGDRIGHKKLLLCGATGFGLMSAAIAFAPNAEMLIVARALLGLAGATLMPATLALIRTLFPDRRERTVAIGIWGSAAAAGAALGPVLGGLLLEHFWWGSVFLINVPVMVIVLAAGIALLPEMRNSTPGPWDMPSVGLSMIGILGIIYAIKETAAHGVHVGSVAVAIVGATALTAFVRRQLILANPVIDMRLFLNRAFSGVVIADLLAALGLSGVVFFLSQFFQLVQGFSPLKAGLAETPAALAAMICGVLAGGAARRWSPHAVLASALLLMGLATASLAVLTPSTPYPQLGVALFVVGVGIGLAMTIASDVILASVPKERAGAASAVSETAYEFGTALGIAILGSIVTGVYRGFAVPAGTDAGIVHAAHDSLAGAIQGAAALPAPQAAALLESAKQAFTDGLATSAGVGAVLLVIAAVVVWQLVKPPKRPATSDDTAPVLNS